jgi:hypothetical protein
MHQFKQIFLIDDDEHDLKIFALGNARNLSLSGVRWKAHAQGIIDLKNRSTIQASIFFRSK